MESNVQFPHKNFQHEEDSCTYALCTTTTMSDCHAVRQRYWPYILMLARDQRCACIALVAMKVTSVGRNDLLADIYRQIAACMKTAVTCSFVVSATHAGRLQQCPMTYRQCTPTTCWLLVPQLAAAVLVYAMFFFFIPCARALFTDHACHHHDEKQKTNFPQEIEGFRNLFLDGENVDDA